MRVLITGTGVLAPGVGAPTDLTRQLSDLAPPPGGATGRPADRRDVVDGADWFDPVRHLGARGWRYLTPATRYLLAAANQALGRRHGTELPPEHRPEEVGVFTATHHPIRATHARLDRVLRGEGVTGLSPVELPGFSVNIPASQLAIALACRAFSVTLTNPVVSGLEALLLAGAALRRGRARRVLATATEETAPGCPSGAAAALVLGAEGSGVPAGELLGGVSRFVPVSDGRPDPAARDAAVERTAALVRGHSRIRYAWCGPTDPGMDEAVRRALAADGVVLTDCRHPGADGRFGTVSGLLQVVAALQFPGPALVVAGSGTGHLVSVAVTAMAPVPADRVDDPQPTAVG